MSRAVKIAISIAVLIVIAAVAGYFLSKSAGSGPVIKTAKASKTSLKVTVSASGKISAGDRADVYPPTEGTLVHVYVKDGQHVKAGRKLAKMDTGPLEMAVEQAEAGVQQAEAGVETLNNATPSSLDEAAAQAAVTAANENYKYTKKVYEDAKKLPYTPSRDTTITAAKVAMKQAYASLVSAEAALYSVEKNRNVDDQQEAADASIDSAEAALDVAEANLDNSTLLAPMDGTVFFNPVGTAGSNGEVPLPSKGCGVSPVAAPFSVVHLGTSTFTAEVDEADIDRVKLGMNADVTLDAFPGQTFQTTVVHINPAAQPTATGGTIFEVELSMNDTGETILLGMKGDSTIQVSAVERALTIPVEALFNQNGQNYVYKIVDNKLVQTNITVGATTDTQVQVVSGLNDSDAVALAGATQYSDGMTVRTQ